VKLTKTILKKIICDVIKEDLGGYEGGVRADRAVPTRGNPEGTDVAVVRPVMDERLDDLIKAIGEEEFIKELIKSTDSAALNSLIKRLAKEHRLSIGGVRYFEENENEEDNEEDEKEYTMLPSVYGQADPEYPSVKLTPRQKIHRMRQHLKRTPKK